MKAENLLKQIKEMAGMNGPKEKESGGILYYRDRYGYVLSGQGEMYTKELAEKWGKARRAGKSYGYFTQDCARWIGRRVVDCSGLLVQAFRAENPQYGDRTANTFRSQFAGSGPVSSLPETPGTALWKSGHIGVYLGGGKVLESRGTAYGVVISPLSSQKWKEWGYLRDVEYGEAGADTPAGGMVEVLGGSVNVRAGDNTETAILGVAHKGDSFLLEGVSASGWYKIDYDGKDGYISSRSDLTRIAGEVHVSFTVGRLLKKTSPLMTGEDVRDVQAALIAKGYSCGNTGADGEFGSNTESAVKSFQKAAGLTADGIVGEKTTQALGGEWKAAGTTWSVSRILKKTSPLMKGADVKALQSALIAKGYSCGGTGADGEFGKNTESAVKSFQKAAGLTVDGKAGKNTVTKLGGKWLVPLG